MSHQPNKAIIADVSKSNKGLAYPFKTHHIILSSLSDCISAETSAPRNDSNLFYLHNIFMSKLIRGILVREKFLEMSPK